MCDELDESYRFWEERRKTRRVRRCSACFERIEPGFLYVRLLWTDSPRSVQRETHCLRCSTVFRALLRRAKPGETVAFNLDCGEVIEDTEHPLQELAFAIPSDFMT